MTPSQFDNILVSVRIQGDDRPLPRITQWSFGNDDQVWCRMRMRRLLNYTHCLNLDYFGCLLLVYIDNTSCNGKISMHDSSESLWLAEHLRNNRKNRSRSYFHGSGITADFYRLWLERNGIFLRISLIATEFENGITTLRLRHNGNGMLETRRKSK